VSALAFSPDGKTMASASADCSIKLWDTRNWQEIRTLKGSLDEVYGVVFSGDGKTLFSGTKDGKILAWDARPQPPTTRVLRRPDDAADFLLSLPSGIPFCVRSNQTFNMWDPKTLRKFPIPPPIESKLWIDHCSIAISPVSGLIAMATHSGPIYLLGAEGKSLFSPAGMTSELQVVQFSPNGKLLAAAAAGESLRVWDVERREVLATMQKSDTMPSCGPCFTTNGQMVAVGNQDGTVEVWSLARNELVGNWKAHNEAISGLTFMPDGNGLVTVSWDNQAKVWDPESHRELMRLGRALNAYSSVAVSPDGQRIAAGTPDGLIRIWNSTTGQELLTLKGVNDWEDTHRPGRWFRIGVNRLAFLPPDGNTLISSARDEVRLWRAPSWAEIEAADAKK
jgi:WD40 repeat protein